MSDQNQEQEQQANNGWQIFCPEENTLLGNTFYSSEEAFNLSKAHNAQTGHNSSIVPCTNC
jgi:hypothetical protein